MRKGGLFKIIMEIKMSCRGQVGLYLPWVVGFLIIFFIIVFLNIGSGAIAGQKRVLIFGGGSDEIILKKYQGNLDIRRDLISFLNSPVEYEDGNAEIIDVILVSLDNYFEIKSAQSGKVSLMDVYGIEGLSEIKPLKAEAEGFDKDEIAKLEVDNQIFAGLIVKELRKRCERFYLLIPQGLINENGLLASEDVLGQDILRNEEEQLMYWTRTVEFPFYYKGYNFEIKYRQLKECAK